MTHAVRKLAYTRTPLLPHDSSLTVQYYRRQ